MARNKGYTSHPACPACRRKRRHTREEHERLLSYKSFPFDPECPACLRGRPHTREMHEQMLDYSAENIWQEVHDDDHLFSRLGILYEEMIADYDEYD